MSDDSHRPFEADDPLQRASRDSASREDGEGPDRDHVRHDGGGQASEVDDADALASVGDHAADDRGLGDATVISNRPPLNALPDRSLAPRELGATLVGRNLAHFQLQQYVGGGGMGAVFRATDTMLDRSVAVKVLSRDQGQDDETVRRFHNEAQSAARLDHDNIARVYYVGEDDGWYFIVFEFIEGRNLREHVTGHGPMPFAQALLVAQQVASALEHSTQRDVVHRDIKPSNVLLTPAGRAKLVDMGLARLRPLHSSDQDLTASGVTLGTFDYISPEQARDPRIADVRSDIYSLGCTFFFMLTGRPPFPDGTVLQKLLSHSGDAPPDPREVRDDLPDAIIPVLNRMLAKKPEDRYQDPSQLIDDLNDVAEQCGLRRQVSARRSSAVPAARWRRLPFHLPWIVPVATLLVVMAVVQPTGLVSSGERSIDPVSFQPPRDPGPSLPADGSTTNQAATGSANAIGQSLTADSNGETTRGNGPVTGDTSEGDAAEEQPVTGNGDRSVVPLDDASSGTPRPAGPPRPLDRNGDSSSGEGRLLDTGESRRGSPRRLIVSRVPDLPANDGEVVVSSLAEACRTALQSQGAIERIEIRHDGPLELTPLELEMEGRELQWVAAEGYRPILTFKTPVSVANSRKNGMIRVVGGRLTLRGLQLEMTIPAAALDAHWSLFQLEQVRSLRLERSSVVTRNAQGARYSSLDSGLDDVAVFRCIKRNRRGSSIGEDSASNPTTEIRLVNALLRCEATVLSAREALPIEFQWQNGLLVTSERFARIGGCSSPPAKNQAIRITMRNLTAVADRGLGQFVATSTRPHLMPIRIQCDDSIWATQRWASLIQQSGPRSATDFRNQLDFAGSGIGYDGMEQVWRITPQDATQTSSWGFQRWQQHWQLTDQLWHQVPWKTPLDRSRPIHELTPSDYVLLELGSDSGVDPLGFSRSDLVGLAEEVQSEPALLPETTSRPQF